MEYTIKASRLWHIIASLAQADSDYTRGFSMGMLNEFMGVPCPECLYELAKTTFQAQLLKR